MIYEAVSTAASIRQGDVFAGIPRVEMSLSEISIIDESDQPAMVSWDDILKEKRDRISAVCAVRPVNAIVITQDCDALRAADITLCEIRPLAEVDGAFKNPGKGPDWWAKMIPQQCQRNLKWFYLPPDPLAGYSERMAVDFRVCIRVSLQELQAMTHLRNARLNPEADEHFRERLSEFFRRYPYDEWYPLNRDEFNTYREKYDDAEPREYQKPVSET